MYGLFGWSEKEIYDVSDPILIRCKVFIAAMVKGPPYQLEIVIYSFEQFLI